MALHHLHDVAEIMEKEKKGQQRGKNVASTSEKVNVEKKKHKRNLVLMMVSVEGMQAQGRMLMWRRFSQKQQFCTSVL